MSTPNRNDPCPCGSGKKYKKCCLINPATAQGYAVQATKQTSHGFNATNVAPASERLMQAVALHQAGMLDEAGAIYQSMLRSNPNDSDALHYLGLIAFQQSRFQDAVKLIGSAIRINSRVPAFHCNLGNAQMALGNPEAAIAAFQEAVRLDFRFQAAHSNLGNAFKELGRLDEAVACHRKALALRPDFAEAHNNLAGALRAQGKLDEAVACYDTALSLNPNYADAYSNLSAVLHEQGRQHEAVASCRKAIALNPVYADAYNNLGNALAEEKQHEEAVACYRKALTIKPNYPFALGQYLHNKMRCCDWSGIEDAFHQLLNGIDEGQAVSVPFSLLAIPSSSAQQKRGAEIFAQEKYPGDHRLSHINQYSKHDKIRIGYFSADFRSHAVSFFITDIFEAHDRTKFEVYAFSFGPDTQDDVRKRLEGSFDRFIDIRNRSHQEVVQLARAMEIDIAINLGGYTQGNRTEIFAMRVAPVQVSYLGYPGTMGVNYIDYLIADNTLIPASSQCHYSEKIVYLPHCYQVNSKRATAEKVFSREELGLPSAGFIFCCFNANYKITPNTFSGWMRILKRVEGSVLWLLEDNSTVSNNLRNEAIKQGVNGDRLIFAKRMPLTEHLARHHAADLFIDTFPCNAGSTASDALWTGLPVLTCMGETFVSRVAASLLHALHLPELITTTQEEYEALAIDLATHPERLMQIKHALESNRLTAPLFSAAGLTRNIEDAFTQMWERCNESLLPDHIFVTEDEKSKVN